MTIPFTLEEHMRLWNRAWVQLLDIRHCSFQTYPLDFALPANGFIYCPSRGAAVALGETRYPDAENWLLHGSCGTQIRIEPETVEAGSFYLLLYQAHFPSASEVFPGASRDASEQPLEQASGNTSVDTSAHMSSWEVTGQHGSSSAVRIGGHPFLVKQLHQLTQLWNTDRAAAQLEAKAGFLSLIQEWVQLQHQPALPSNQERINGLVEFMQLHYAQPLTLAQLADQANYSVQHLSVLFKEATGLAPIEYLMRLRMDAAKRLLDEGKLTLPQVAEQVGYKDPYYFGRLFKRFVGQSPMKYKQAAERLQTSKSKLSADSSLLLPSSSHLPRQAAWANRGQTQLVVHALGEAFLPSPPRRIVALDWTMAEYLLTLGIVPLGIAELSGMHKWVRLPVGIPARTRSIGPRLQPDLQAIEALRPDLIVGTRMLAEPFYADLSQIAPTVTYDLFPAPAGCMEHECLQHSFMHLASVLGMESLGQAVWHWLEEMYKAMNRRLQQAALPTRKCVVAFGYTNQNHPQLRLSTDGSLVIGVLERLGLTNAYMPGHYEQLGFTTAGLEQLAHYGDAHIIHIAPQDDTSIVPSWKRLGNSSQASIWPYGGPMSSHLLALTTTHVLMEAIG